MVLTSKIMKKLKQFLASLIFLAILIYALAFAVRNDQPLEIDFLFAAPISLPVSLWLGLTLCLGAALGLLSGLWMQMRQWLQQRKAKKPVDNA